MIRSISSVKALVAVVAAGAAAAIAATAPATATAVADAPGEAAAILALTLALQAMTFRLPRHGSIGFASLGLVLAGITLGIGPALVVGAATGVAQWIRTRGRLVCGVFDAGNLALSAGGAAGTYAALVTSPSDGTRQFIAAAFAGAVFVAVNHGLLCLVMSVAESRPVRELWRERFRWARYYLAALAPLTGAATIGHHPLGFGVTVACLLTLLLLVQMRRSARSLGAPERQRTA